MRRKPDNQPKPIFASGSLGRVDAWLFDMDDTIHNSSAGLFREVHRSIQSYLEKYFREQCGYDEQQVLKLQEGYWSQYGATFLGLERNHGLAPQVYFQNTHTFDILPYVKTDIAVSRLKTCLRRLPGRKYVYSNGPECYAGRIIDALGIRDLFEDVFVPETMRVFGQWTCKPERISMETIVAKLRVAPEHVVLVDDGLANLKTAKALGLKTVWSVGCNHARPSRKPAYVDRVIRSLIELERMVAPRQALAQVADGGRNLCGR